MAYLMFIFLLLSAAFFAGNLTKKIHHSKSNNGKIIGGSNATIEDYPYQAYLRISKIGDGEHKYHQCGGSIISDSFILTAAHCLVNATEVQARIGSSEASTGGKVYHSAYHITHHRYNTNTKDYDIAILKTQRKMTLDGVKTKAITLVKRKMNVPSGSMVTVSGWGRIAPEGPLSPTLLTVELPTLSNDECNKILGGISERQLCAGPKDGSKDICKGDSGGPAVLSDNRVQVGIVSASYACAEPNSPSIFTNVTDLRGWIKMNTGV